MSYNQWEIKQIIDIVSKGVNSVLMNTNKETTIKELENLATGLTKIYCNIYKELKKDTKSWGVKIPPTQLDKKEKEFLESLPEQEKK